MRSCQENSLTIILALPLIQERHLSSNWEIMGTKYMYSQSVKKGCPVRIEKIFAFDLT